SNIISRRNMMMTMKFARLALLACLAGASVIAAGQNNSSSSASDSHAVAVGDAGSHERNYSLRKESGSDCGKKKHKEKSKHDAKPAPSKEEQEFDRVLLGIHG